MPAEERRRGREGVGGGGCMRERERGGEGRGREGRWYNVFIFKRRRNRQKTVRNTSLLFSLWEREAGREEGKRT